MLSGVTNSFVASDWEAAVHYVSTNTLKIRKYGAEYNGYKSLAARRKNLRDSQLQSALGKKRRLLSVTFEIRQNVLSPGRKCHANAGDDNTR